MDEQKKFIKTTILLFYAFALFMMTDILAQINPEFATIGKAVLGAYVIYIIYRIKKRKKD